MANATKVQTQIKQLAKEVKACRSYIFKSFKKVTALVAKTGGKNYKKEAVSESEHIREKFLKVEQRLFSLQDSVASNNYLLEYKQKDLLVQADSLQDALDEISIRNKELNAQKLQISEQAEKLRLSHEQILEKNDALE